MTAHPSDAALDAYRLGQPWRLQAEHLPIRCEDSHDRHDRHLCAGCEADLRAVLQDVPALALDLQVALTRQTSFVQHGLHRRRDEEGEDEGEPVEGSTGPLPWDEAAAKALHHLATALRAGGHVEPLTTSWVDLADQALGQLPNLLLDPQVGAWAERLSRAVLHGYRVVDRPPDVWYFGPCPKCGEDIYDERTVTDVSCVACTYSAPLADHQLACLDAGDDRLLTVSELVGAITAAGEAVTRDQINGWIRREGLAREPENRVVWRKGRLSQESVWVYRLGDVRRLAREAEERRAA